MSTLFTINKPWFDRAQLYESLAFATSEDAILLLQDAVLALQSPVSLASFVAKCEQQGVRVFALENDLALRGIENQYSAVKLIDYDGFVRLVVEHNKQVAW